MLFARKGAILYPRLVDFTRGADVYKNSSGMGRITTDRRVLYWSGDARHAGFERGRWIFSIAFSIFSLLALYDDDRSFSAGSEPLF